MAHQPNVRKRPDPLRNDDPDRDLFQTLYPSLRRYAAVAGSEQDDPDDLVQEVLARALRLRPLNEIDSPQAYLRRAITNLVIDRARQRRTLRQRRHLLSTDATAADVYPSDLDVLESLDAMDRAILFQVDIERRPFAEVAKVVGCSPVAARIRASRARRRLRTLLEESP